MKIRNWITALLFLGMTVEGQVILSDDYNISGAGTGFGLNAGVNSGINPPTTRLIGTAATDLRYIPTSTKEHAAFSIVSNKLRVTSAANPGRFTFSSNGSFPFDFSPHLGTSSATPQQPVVYDLTISMDNDSAGTQRCSFALGIAEGDATTWDFGVQIYRTASSDDFYTIAKRIDVAASGLASDLNLPITNTAVGTYGTEITFLMRVTDAGHETTQYNSRVQLSMDEGLTWFYDTATDPDLVNGFRLNGPGRFVIWDVAPNAGNVTYDNFSLSPVPITISQMSPPNSAQGLGAAVHLQATVSNTLPGNLTVTFHGRPTPAPAMGEDFVIAVLPDTQNYAREASGIGNATKEMWFAQTEWIITNRVKLNIAYVATLGDCVHNATSHTQWRNATNAYYRLESQARTFLKDGIPYGVTVGNHDQDTHGDPDSPTTYYNQYFGTAHFQDKAYYGGHFSSNNDNWYNVFSAGGMDFLVFSFEFGRYGSTVMNWAQSVINQYPNHRIIVLTHHAGSDNHPSNLSNQGEAIYEALKVNPQFFLMMAGHVFNGSGHGEGHRTNTFNGNRVYTLISNYQNRNNGGNGLMRVMTFSPRNNLISIKTYSPWTGAYETDFNSEFTLPYNMQSGDSGTPEIPFASLQTNTTIVPGGTASFTWSGLLENKSYDWFVRITDTFGNQTTSSIQTFATTNNAIPVVTNRFITVEGDQPIQLTLTASDANGDVLTFQTNSHPVRGLITEFDSANGTVVYLPAHGYRGLERFTYSATDSATTSPLANVDLNVVAPADTNTNGLPDSWEAKYAITDPDADDDGDGLDNYGEYLANTNPTNSMSAVRILDSFQDENGLFGISWSSVGGTRYRVQYADGNGHGVGTNFTDIIRLIHSEMDPARYGSPSVQSYFDNIGNTGTNKARFYRVRVAP